MAQIQWIIFHNQLAFTKFGRCLPYRVLMTSIVQARGCFSSAVLIMRINRYGIVTFVSPTGGQGYRQMMANGTLSARHGTTTMALISSSKMERWKNKRKISRRATPSRPGDLWFWGRNRIKSATISRKTRALWETWLGLMCGPMSCQKTLSLLFLNLAPVTLESEETSTNGPILSTELKDVPRLKFPLLVFELA